MAKPSSFVDSGCVQIWTNFAKERYENNSSILLNCSSMQSISFVKWWQNRKTPWCQTKPFHSNLHQFTTLEGPTFDKHVAVVHIDRTCADEMEQWLPCHPQWFDKVSAPALMVDVCRWSSSVVCLSVSMLMCLSVIQTCNRTCNMMLGTCSVPILDKNLEFLGLYQESASLGTNLEILDTYQE
jgi:hypothetical protein